MLRLLTLGGLDLRSGEGRQLLSVLAQPKRVALLSYLALAKPPGGHRRDTLVGLLWPEHDQAHARHALRQAIYFLRRSLGDSVLTVHSDDEVAVEPTALWCDAVAFETAIDGGRPEEALALYAGDLLTGFFVGEAAGFERWLEGERERLRGRAAEAAWQVSDLREQAGDAAGATSWGRRAATLAPADEGTLRRLMLLMERHGDRAGAIRAYQAFAWRLETEYEIEPSVETRVFAEEMRQRDQPIPRPTATDESDASSVLTSIVERPAVNDQPTEAAAAAGRRHFGLPHPRSLVAARRAFLPVVIVLLTFGLLTVYARLRNASGANADSRSLAVLEFTDLGSGGGQSDFASGFTDELIAHLARISDLRVSGRGSALAFRSGDGSPNRVGQALGVRYLVEGGVRREGDHVRVNARLVNARTSREVWAHDYDHALQDAQLVPKQIAASVAGALGVRLRDEVEGGPAAATPEAYELFVRGRAHYFGTTSQDLESAIVLLQAALARDPGFAEAHAFLARGYAISAGVGSRHAAEAAWLDSALFHARRAIQLAPALPEGHSALGEVLRWMRRPQEAIEQHEAALALAPTYALSVHEIGQLYGEMGRLDDALIWTKRAIKLEPTLLLHRRVAARFYRRLGFRHEAEREVAAGLQIAPEDRLLLEKAMQLALERRDTVAAAAYLRRLQLLEPPAGREEVLATYAFWRGDLATVATDVKPGDMAGWSWNLLHIVGIAYLAEGKRAQATALLRSAAALLVQDSAEVGAPFDNLRYLAHIQLLLGNREAALQTLGTWRARVGMGSWDAADISPIFDLERPEWAPLRGDARFQALVAESRVALHRAREHVLSEESLQD